MLIYGMLMSADGYTEDERGKFGWGAQRFFPNGMRMNLDLVEERRFGSGVIALRYAVRRKSSQ
jgi:hypothetical protein